MVVAGHVLGARAGYQEAALKLSEAAVEVLLEGAGPLAAMARRPFRKVVYLGTGANEGAARESALKMLEMTAGRVFTLAESFLGLRHGPMSLVDSGTLVVVLFSSDEHVRRYEIDVVRELKRKELGGGFVLAGGGIPSDLRAGQDAAVSVRASGDTAAVALVLTGQLLALFRCLAEGLKPDEPSDSGVITRVVNTFRIYERSQ
jgi:tagatose-6-phosphate ketose/aldose isomerase